MKKLIAVTALGCVLSLNLLAEDVSSGHRKLEGENGQITQHTGVLEVEHAVFEKDLDVQGRLKAKDTTFNATLTVNGRCDLRNVVGQSVSVEGYTDIEDTTLRGDLQVRGYFKADDSQLQSVTIHGIRGEMNDCTAGDITFEAVEGHSEEPTLVLSGETAITGKITFKSGRGTIMVVGNDVSYSDTSGAAVVNVPEEGK